MLPSAILFSATGAVQTYVVPATGGYLIEACGAQSASAENPGARGDRVKGLFYLHRGDLLKIFAGSRHASPVGALLVTAGGEGRSLVWRGASDTPLPSKLLLAARGGHREKPADPGEAGWSDSFNAGAFQANTPAIHIGDGYVSIAPGMSRPAPLARTEGPANASAT
jgi:hypothetical protein